MMTLTVQHKRAYGVDRFYPACPQSRALLALSERLTFTMRMLEGLVRNLGYRITVQNEAGEALYILEKDSEEILREAARGT